jgi:hypothetical protein
MLAIGALRECPAAVNLHNARGAYPLPCLTDLLPGEDEILLLPREFPLHLCHLGIQLAGTAGPASTQPRPDFQPVAPDRQPRHGRPFRRRPIPAEGVLILGEIGDADGFGDSILRDIAKSLSFEYFSPSWSFSVGALWDGQDQVIVREISLTKTPAYNDAKVLAVGEEAPQLFAMLTEKRAVDRQ